MPSDFGPSFDKYLEGRSAMDQADLSRAIELFEESVRLSPHFKTLELLGECRLKNHQPSEAILPLAAAVGLGTNAFRAMYLLAKAYSDVGNKESALKYADRALQINPDFKNARELKESLSAAK
jgi:tetratricopeptide (TPR) repeat protein